MQHKKKDNELLAMARQAIIKAQAKSIINDLKDDDLNIANSTQTKNLILRNDLEKNNIEISNNLKDHIDEMQILLDDIIVELDTNDTEVLALTNNAQKAISLLKITNPQLASTLENSINIKNRKKSKIVNKKRM